MSRTSTVSLPTARANSMPRATVASVVSGARTTSTRRMAGTGLKKCSPTTWLDRPEAAPSSWIDNQLVRRFDRGHVEPGGAGHERDTRAHDPAADDGRLRHDATSLLGRSSLRR